LEARSQAFRKEIGSSGHTDIASPNPNGRIARCHPGGGESLSQHLLHLTVIGAFADGITDTFTILQVKPR